MRRNNFFGFGCAGIFGIAPFPFPLWGNSGRRRLDRRSVLGRSRRFSRIHGIIHKGWSFLIVVRDNAHFFDFSILRKRSNAEDSGTSKAEEVVPSHPKAAYDPYIESLVSS
jgi:hypothetical protein